jgi:hypothetical protein
MAGAFGYEAEHYQVGIECGERVLLPEVRNASPETLIIADGFSCREQITQQTDRKALHLAQVLQMASREQSQPPSEYPDRGYSDEEKTPALPMSVVAASMLLGAGAFWGARAIRRRFEG